MKKVMILGLLVLSMCGISFAADHVIYVNVENTSVNEDGLSWGAAFKSFSSVYSSITWNPADSYDIWIAEGEYPLLNKIDFNNAAVIIRGGFSGTEESLSEWDPRGHIVNITAKYTEGVVQFYNDGNLDVRWVNFHDFNRHAVVCKGLGNIENCSFNECYCGLWIGNGTIYNTLFFGCGRGDPSLADPVPNQGAFVCSGFVDVYNCNFIENQKDGSTIGIICYPTDPYQFTGPPTSNGPRIYNSIFWNNDFDKSPAEVPFTFVTYSHLLSTWQNDVLTRDMIDYNSGTMILEKDIGAGSYFSRSNPRWYWYNTPNYSLARYTPDNVVNECRDGGGESGFVSEHPYDLYGKDRVFGSAIDIGVSEYGDTIVDFSGSPRYGTASPKETVGLSEETIDVENDLLYLKESWWSTDMEVFVSPVYGSTLPAPLDINVRYWLRLVGDKYELYQNGKYGDPKAYKIDFTTIGSGTMVVCSGVLFYSEDLTNSEKFDTDNNRVILTRGFWGDSNEISFEIVSGLLPNGIVSAKRYFLENQLPHFYFWTLTDSLDSNNIYQVPIDIIIPDPIPVMTIMEFVGEIVDAESSVGPDTDTIELNKGGISTISSWGVGLKVNIRCNGEYPGGISPETDYLISISGSDYGLTDLIGNAIDITSTGSGKLSIYLAEGVEIPGKDSTPIIELWSPYNKEKPSSSYYNGISLFDLNWKKDELVVVKENPYGVNVLENTVTKINNVGVFSDSYTIHPNLGSPSIDLTSTGSGVCRAVFRNTPVNLFTNFVDKSTISSGQIIEWRWDFNNDGVIDSTDQNPTHLYNVEGVYSVKLTIIVRPEVGVDFEDNIIKENYVTVTRAGVFLDADFTSNVRCGKAPLSVSFLDSTNSSETSLTRIWDFGDGTTSTEYDPIHIYQDPGTYTVTYTVNYMGEKSVREKKNYLYIPAIVNPRFSIDNVLSVVPDCAIKLEDKSYVLNNFLDTTPAIIATWSWEIYGPEDDVIPCKVGNAASINFSYIDGFSGCGKYRVKLTVGTTDGETATVDIRDAFEILTPIKLGFSLSNNFISPGEKVFVQNDSLLRTTPDKFFPNIENAIIYNIEGPGGSPDIPWTGDWSLENKLSDAITLLDPGIYSVKMTVSGLVNGTDPISYDKEEQSVIVVGEGFDTSFNATPRLGLLPLKVDFKDNSFYGLINLPKTWYWEYGDGGANLWRDLSKVESLSESSYTVIPIYESYSPDTKWGAQPYSYLGNRVGTYSFEGTYADNGIISPASFGESNDGKLPPLASLNYDKNNHVYSPSYIYKSPGVYNVSLTSNGKKITKENFIEAVAPVEVDFSSTGNIGVSPLSVKFYPSIVRYNFDYPVLYEWEFKGVTPSTSTEQSPEIEYMIPEGVSVSSSQVYHFDVALKVTVGNWQTKVVKREYIELLPPVVGEISWVSVGDEPYSIELSPQLFLTRPYDQVTSFSYDCGEYSGSHIFSGDSSTGKATHIYQSGWSTPTLNIGLSFSEDPVSVTSNDQVRCGSDLEVKAFYYPKQGYAPLKVNAMYNAFAIDGEIIRLVSKFADEGTTDIRSWNKGEPNYKGFLRQSHVFNQAGEYKVSLIAQSDRNNPIAYTDTIKVFDPENPTADFTIISASREGVRPAKGIIPYQVKFFDLSSVRGSTIEKWSWDFGDGSTSAEQNPVHTYFREGTYSVTLSIVTKEGKTDTITRDRIIRAMVLPIANFEYEFVPNTFLGGDTTFLVNRHNTSEIEDGKTWSTGYSTIQEAVDAAEAVGGGDVWVSEGWYGYESNIIRSKYGFNSVGGDIVSNTPNETKGTFSDSCLDHEKHSVVVLPGNVNLYGGFNTRSKSILDQDSKKNVVVVSGSFTSEQLDPDSKTDCVIQVDGDSIIEGLTIVGGCERGRFFGTDSEGFDCYDRFGFGGGVSSNNSRVEINDCRFLFNSSLWGGGAVSAQKCIATIKDCEFIGNTSCAGSCIMSYDPSGEKDSFLNIQDSTFSRNFSGSSFLSVGEIVGDNYYSINSGYVAFPEEVMAPRMNHPVLVEKRGEISEKTAVNWGNIVFINMAGNGVYENAHGAIYMMDITKALDITGESPSGVFMKKLEGGGEVSCTVEPFAYCIYNERGTRALLSEPIETCDGMLIFELNKTMVEVISDSATYHGEEGKGVISIGEYVSIDGVNPSIEGLPDFVTQIELRGIFSNNLDYDPFEYISGREEVRLEYVSNQLIAVDGASGSTTGLNYFDLYGDFSDIENGTVSIDTVKVVLGPNSILDPSIFESLTQCSWELLSKNIIRVEIPSTIKENNYSGYADYNNVLTVTAYIGYDIGYGMEYSNGIWVSFYDPDVSGGFYTHTTPTGAVWFEGNQGNIVDCIFNNNFSMGGGVLHIEDNMIVESSTFEDNKGGIGGAVLLDLEDSSATTSNVSLDSCRFIGNEAYGNYGGAIAGIQHSTLYDETSGLLSIKVTDPFVLNDPVVPVSTSKKVEVKNCFFAGNRSYNLGAAIAYGSTTSNSILHSTFFDNYNSEEYAVYDEEIVGISQIALNRSPLYSIINSVIWSRRNDPSGSEYAQVSYGGTSLTLKDSVLKGYVESQFDTSNIIENVSAEDPDTINGYNPYSFKLKDESNNYVDMRKEGHSLSEDLLIYGDTFSTDSDYISLLRPEWKENNFVRIYRTDTEGEDIPDNLPEYGALINKSEGGSQVSREGGGFSPSPLTPFEGFYPVYGVPSFYEFHNYTAPGAVIDIEDFGNLYEGTDNSGYIFPIMGNDTFWEHSGYYGNNTTASRISNGGFSTGDPPTGWVLVAGATPLVSMTKVASPVHSGTAALRIDVPNTGTAPIGYVYQTIATDRITPGQIYSFYCYSRLNTGAAAPLMQIWNNGASIGSVNLLVGANYAVNVGTFTAPASFVNFQLRLIPMVKNTSIYVDDVGISWYSPVSIYNINTAANTIMFPNPGSLEDEHFLKDDDLVVFDTANADLGITAGVVYKLYGRTGTYPNYWFNLRGYESGTPIDLTDTWDKVFTSKVYVKRASFYSSEIDVGKNTIQLYEEFNTFPFNDSPAKNIYYYVRNGVSPAGLTSNTFYDLLKVYPSGSIYKLSTDEEGESLIDLTDNGFGRADISEYIEEVELDSNVLPENNAIRLDVAEYRGLPVPATPSICFAVDDRNYPEMKLPDWLRLDSVYRFGSNRVVGGRIYSTVYQYYPELNYNVDISNYGKGLMYVGKETPCFSLGSSFSYYDANDLICADYDVVEIYDDPLTEDFEFSSGDPVIFKFSKDNVVSGINNGEVYWINNKIPWKFNKAIRVDEYGGSSLILEKEESHSLFNINGLVSTFNSNEVDINVDGISNNDYIPLPLEMPSWAKPIEKGDIVVLSEFLHYQAHTNVIKMKGDGAGSSGEDPDGYPTSGFKYYVVESIAPYTYTSTAPNPTYSAIYVRLAEMSNPYIPIQIWGNTATPASINVFTKASQVEFPNGIYIESDPVTYPGGRMYFDDKIVDTGLNFIFVPIGGTIPTFFGANGINRVYSDLGTNDLTTNKSSNLYYVVDKEGDDLGTSNYVDFSSSEEAFTTWYYYCGYIENKVLIGSKVDIDNDVILLTKPPSDINSVRMFLKDGLGEYPVGIDSGVRYTLVNDASYPAIEGTYAYRLVSGDIKNLVLKNNNVVDLKTVGSGSLIVSNVVCENIPLIPDVLTINDDSFSPMENSIHLISNQNRTMFYSLDDYFSWDTGKEVLFLTENEVGSTVATTPTYNLEGSVTTYSILDGVIYEVGSRVNSNNRFSIIDVSSLVDPLRINFLTSGSGYIEESTYYPEGSHLYGNMYAFCSQEDITEISDVVNLATSTMSVTKDLWVLKDKATGFYKRVIVTFKGDDLPSGLSQDTPYLAEFLEVPENEDIYNVEIYSMSRNQLSALYSDEEIIQPQQVIFGDEGSGNVSIWVARNVLGLGSKIDPENDSLFLDSTPKIEKPGEGIYASWSSYIGGEGAELYNMGGETTVDVDGNVYVVGTTNSSNWVSGGYNTTRSGDYDAFVVKFDSKGVHKWSTYVGGSGKDCGYSIDTDSTGNLYVAGMTNSSGWVSGGSDTSYNGGSFDGYVVKLGSDGSHIWSTYVGGGSMDYATTISVDPNGVYVAGTTISAGWVSGGWDTSYGGSNEGYIVKISTSGTYLWSSYIGGANIDSCFGTDTDSSGNIYVAGSTQSPGWVSGGYDTVYNGMEGYVVKLSTGGAHIWSTYVGGTSDDCIYDITVDPDNNLYAVGFTNSIGWVSGGYNTSYGNNRDGFVVKINPFGTHLWSSYIGGSSDDYSEGVSVDTIGDVYITGKTSSPGWVSGGYDTILNGNSNILTCDGYVAKLSKWGSFRWSTYIGGSKNEWGYSIALDSMFNVYVTGKTESSNWIKYGWDVSYGGNGDSYIIKIIDDNVRQRGPFYLFPYGTTIDISMLDDDPLNIEDPDLRMKARVGLVGDISTLIKLGDSGWYNVSPNENEIKICDDRWSIGNEVSFYPGDVSSNIPELPVGKVFKISAIRDAEEYPYHYIKLVDSITNYDVLLNDTYEGRLTMYRVSRCGEETPIDMNYVNFRNNTLRLEGVSWELGDIVNLTSNYWSRLPYKLFESRSYIIYELLYGRHYTEAKLYDILSNSITSFVDFARSIVQMKGTAYLNQSAIASIFKNPGEDGLELSESFRDDNSDMTFVDLSDDTIDLMRQDWKDGDSVFFNTANEYLVDPLDNAKEDPDAVPSQPYTKPDSLELAFETLFPERIKGVRTNRKNYFSEEGVFNGGEVVVVWGDHLIRVYLGRTDLSTYILEGKVVGDLLCEYIENSEIKDVVFGPYRQRIFVISDDKKTPFKTYGVPPNNATFLYSNPLPDKFIHNVIAVETDIQTIQDTIVLTDNYLKGESGIYYVNNGQDLDRPLINTDYNFIPPIEVSGAIPLAMRSYSPTFVGMPNLLFVLYSNNKVVCYDVKHKIGSDISPILNGVFSYTGIDSPSFQYLNIGEYIEELTNNSKVRFVVGSKEGVVFVGGVDVNASTGAVVVEGPAPYTHIITYPIGSIWSQFRYDNSDLIMDYISKRGMFEKKEGVVTYNFSGGEGEGE